MFLAIPKERLETSTLAFQNYGHILPNYIFYGSPLFKLL
jgi:hypothetical protein